MRKFDIDELSKIKEFIYYQINNLNTFKKSKLVCELFPKEGIENTETVSIVLFNEKNRDYFLHPRMDEELLKPKYAEGLEFSIEKWENNSKKSIFKFKKEYFFKLNFHYYSNKGVPYARLKNDLFDSPIASHLWIYPY